MDAMIYLGQENDRLSASSIKSRQRLQSAPERLSKTPKLRPVGSALSGRKALGAVNKIVATPAASQKAEALNKPLGTQKCKVAQKPTGQDYPEIEKCFPYNPSDFEIYTVPEEVCLSRLSLAGLAKQWPATEFEDFTVEPCLPLSPLKMPSENCRDELEAFLEAVNELTVDLPPEC
ncbi:securin isoform X2 [Trichomycterus rosablanca]